MRFAQSTEKFGGEATSSAVQVESSRTETVAPHNGAEHCGERQGGRMKPALSLNVPASVPAASSQCLSR